MADDWRAVAKKVRNWGNWGTDDQLGTLNYITPQKIAQATTLPSQGKVFPLSIPIDAYGPQGAHGFRRNPIHIMSVDGGDEQVAAVASDNIAVEVFASEFPDATLVFHLLVIRDMGMMLGEIWDLEALSQDCAADKTYAFLLVAQPLRVSGAVGSPVNPVAIK
jgi:hypothetical protein